MRVLHVTRDFPPRINGGLSTAVGGMVRASLEAGIDCAVISFDAWRPRAKTAMPLVEERFGAAPVLRLRDPSHLERARTFAEADVVHVHDPLLWSFARSVSARRRIFTVHVAQAEVARIRGLQSGPLPASVIAEAEALSEADRVTIPAAELAPLFSAVGDLRVVPLGAHPEAWLARSPTAGRVLYVGRFSAIKGLDLLVEAWSPQAASAELAIAGGLPDSPKIDRRWRRRLERPGIALLGWLDAEALRAEHGRAAVQVVPSLIETFGLSTLEAMQRGVPVVATRTPGSSALVEHEVTGLLVEPGDAGALTEALSGLLRDPSRAERLGRAAAERVRSCFMWRRRVATLAAAYAD